MAVAGYNGVFTIASVPTATTFTYTNSATSLAASGDGTATNVAVINVPILFTDPSEALRRCPGKLGTAIDLAFRQTPGPGVVWVSRTALKKHPDRGGPGGCHPVRLHRHHHNGDGHGFAAGDNVTISGVAVAGYNGVFTIASVPTATTFTYTNSATSLAASGDGTAALHGWADALRAVSTLAVQFVVIASTPLNSTTASISSPEGAILQLAHHVVSVSNNGGDGMERMGVAMLAKGATDSAIVSGDLASDRMVYVAHKSNNDVAAAVAGTIAGYEPHISLLLKPVNVTSDSFTAAEITAINGSESNFDSAAGQGVNWLTDPVLIPGRSVHLGESYTGNPGGGVKFIDVRRTIDDVSFRLKARLINSIGSVRISRSGLRALLARWRP